MARNRRTVKQIEEALRRTYGTVAAAARLLGMNRQYLHERIAATPRLQEVLDESREFMVDQAELKLVTAVQEGDIRAITFMLSRIGKSRGWGSEVTLNHRRLDVRNMSTEELEAVLRAAYGEDDDGAGVAPLDGEPSGEPTDTP